jgi:thiamine-phosphate pyrophosphorylase
MQSPSDESSPDPRKVLGRLHVITDFHMQQRFSHAELAERAIRGGADSIQFRQKHGGIRNMLIGADNVQGVCREAGVPLIVDDRIDVALSVEAAGVHLGQRDFPIGKARAVVGPDVLVGATATTAEQAASAYEAGADYIGFGPVFPTSSKRNPESVKGPEGLAAACEAVPIPVLAIGGITPDRVQPVLEAGAHGVAVLSAIVATDDPETAANRFRTVMDEAVRALD